MNGSEILATLPVGGSLLLPGIWDVIQAGYYVKPTFLPLNLGNDSHTVKVWVATDALQLGEPGDSFRPMVSALLAQKVADKLGLYLPTAKVVRAAYQEARVSGVLVPPKTQPAANSDRIVRGYSASMSDQSAMIRHSWEVSKAVSLQDPWTDAAAAGVPRRIYSSGKSWIVDKRLEGKAGRGCNHGWYTTSAPYKDAKGVALWQDRGTVHNAGTDLATDPGHYDYSQTLSELVYPWVLVDGDTWLDWEEVLRDPELAPTINDDGVLLTARPYVHPSDVNTSLPALPLLDQMLVCSEGTS
jgi:hypothetical protein